MKRLWDRYGWVLFYVLGAAFFGLCIWAAFQNPLMFLGGLAAGLFAGAIR